MTEFAVYSKGINNCVRIISSVNLYASKLQRHRAVSLQQHGFLAVFPDRY